MRFYSYFLSRQLRLERGPILWVFREVLLPSSSIAFLTHELIQRYGSHNQIARCGYEVDVCGSFLNSSQPNKKTWQDYVLSRVKRMVTFLLPLKRILRKIGTLPLFSVETLIQTLYVIRIMDTDFSMLPRRASGLLSGTPYTFLGRL